MKFGSEQKICPTQMTRSRTSTIWVIIWASPCILDFTHTSTGRNLPYTRKRVRQHVQIRPFQKKKLVRPSRNPGLQLPRIIHLGFRTTREDTDELRHCSIPASILSIKHEKVSISKWSSSSSVSASPTSMTLP